MTRSSICFALALPLIALGCEGQPSGGTAPTSSAAPPKTAAATAKPTATAAAVTATATATAAPTSTSMAASFPATALPSKNFSAFTIGLPPGGKLEKSGEDKSSLETADYKLMLKAGPKTDDLDKTKASIQKMPGFKALTVDKPDGVVVEMEEKGAKQFMITRYVTVDDTKIACESALTKPPKDKDKAQEAWDVCGTIAKGSGAPASSASAGASAGPAGKASAGPAPKSSAAPK